MFKGFNKYLWILGILFSVLVLIEFTKPEKQDWGLSFSKDRKAPFGGYLLYHDLDHLFPGKKKIVGRKTFFRESRDLDTPYPNLLILSPSFYPSTTDEERILDHVVKGGNAFISARYMSSEFLDTLEVERSTTLSMKDSGFFEPPFGRKARLHFTDPFIDRDTGYFFPKGLGLQYFSKTDPVRTKILGKDGNDNAIYIKVSFGKGYFFLHSYPVAFSNYYISHPTAYEYAFKALSYLPVANTYWDEYYKPGTAKQASTPLRFILSRDPLKYALLTIIMGVLLLLTFRVKRIQRPIPVIIPPENSSLSFIRVLSRLYYEYGGHSRISRMKAQQFLYRVRERFGLSTDDLGEEFRNSLSYRSGVDKETIDKTIRMVKHVLSRSETGEHDLVLLDRHIREFESKTAR